MTDLPTGLIECFIATLEDALEADIIIHVQDVAHEDWRLQRDHVEKTLMTLLTKKFPGEESEVIRKLDNIVNVGNKMDLLQEEKDFGELPLISSTTLSGINDLLMDLEDKMLKATDRIKMTIRVPMGGEEMQWLYKNTAVTSSEADANDSQKILLHVVISNVALEQFKHTFIGGVKQKRN
jgi:50S ribosomal subunit-associated GTPase HflX